MEAHECKSIGVVRRVLRNAVTTYVDQCAFCGRQMRSYKKQDVFQKIVGDWDQSIADEWEEEQKRQWKIRSAEYEKAREEKNRLWWEKYNHHIASPKWRELRSMVLRRANNTCEGCGINRAWHVHHDSYEHMGNEFLFELIALCGPCHSRIHGRSVGEEAA